MSYESPITINLRYVDYPFQEANLAVRQLGCTERRYQYGERAPKFREAFRVFSKDEQLAAITLIDESDCGLDRLIVHTFDQGQEGTCTSNQDVQGHMVQQALQFGKDRVVIGSPISLYMQVASGPNTGSAVDEIYDAERTVGFLPQDTRLNREVMGAYFQHYMSPTGYNKSKYQTGWKETAKHFRGDEYFDIESADEFITALCMGFPVGYGRSGHSILAVRPIIRSGQIYAMYINSWGQWGDTLHGITGFGYDSPSMYGTGAIRYGCHAKRTIVVPPWITQ